MRLPTRLAAAVLAGIAAAQDPTPYPAPRGKKGLQVQSVDDALALGIAHAALNVDLGRLMPTGRAGEATIGFERSGERHAFARDQVEALDAQVGPLARAGVVVTAILLATRTGDPAQDRLLVHRGCGAAAPNGIGAFATDTAEGRAWLGAAVEFLAARYSGTSPHGRICNWIVGNEVNSHWWWYHFGEQDLDAVVAAYEAAVRIVHTAVRAQSAHGRVFVSLEHHWSVRNAAGTARQAVPGRDLLLAFAARARQGGDYDWHVAFHPYPEDLFDCRFWEDETARDAPDAPRVTFANLPVLLRFLAREEMRWQGAVRRVLLSEQGFHCRADADGERDQAAALALAWSIVQRLPGIDALILHRHVDHAHEGGLRLGLWTRREGTVCEPERLRRIGEVFAACGTERFAEAAAFALPVVGQRAFGEFPLGGVRAEIDGDVVQVTHDGSPFATVRVRAEPRPFVWPLLGPEGAPRSRSFPMRAVDGGSKDHAHHQSLWFAHGDVSGHDFWHGRGRRERIVTEGPVEIGHEAGASVVRQRYRWLAGEDDVVCVEERTLRFAVDDGARIVDWTTVLHAGARPLVLGDTKEGTFALRVHDDLRADPRVAAGSLCDSEGRRGDAVWGQRARWIDAVGTVDGRAVGVALFDHPDNHGHPTHWHARTYGLLAANPFGVHDFTGAPPGTGRLEVAPGAALTLRYRVVLHGPDWDRARLDAAWRRWK